MKALHFITNETSAIGVHSSVEVYETKMQVTPERNETNLRLNKIWP